jgi:adenylyltransferase/sulfurtransferase
MANLNVRISNLRSTIVIADKELSTLKSQLQHLEKQRAQYDSPRPGSEDSRENKNITPKWPLNPEEYKRYGRQMIVPQMGLQGQHLPNDV